MEDDEQNVDRIKKLFEITKTVMILKNTQAEVAEEELNEIMTKEGKSTAHKGQETMYNCLSACFIK